jgi:hypothetical protein
MCNACVSEANESVSDDVFEKKKFAKNRSKMGRNRVFGMTFAAPPKVKGERWGVKLGLRVYCICLRVCELCCN